MAGPARETAAPLTLDSGTAAAVSAPNQAAEPWHREALETEAAAPPAAVATLPLETLPFGTPLLLLLLHGHGTAAASAIDHATGSGQCALRTTAGTPVASTTAATAPSLLCWAASCVAASAGDAATSVAAEAAQCTVSASSHGRAADALARRLAVTLTANVATTAGCPLLPGSS